MSELFTGKELLPISALKGNIGHTITTSSLAALIKVIYAFKHDVLPPTKISGNINDYLSGSTFRLIDKEMNWPQHDRPRRAAINGFGFGGCNAHAIIEAWEDQSLSQQFYINTLVKEPIAITGIAINSSDFKNKEEFLNAYVNLKPKNKENNLHEDQVELDYTQAHFPPHDLKNTLGQQLYILKSVSDALKDWTCGSDILPQSSSVYIGMQCDPDISRCRLRWRLKQLLEAKSHQVDDTLLIELMDEICPPLTAAHVIGSMPNIVTNRINQQYDCQRASFSYSGEELSGVYALNQALIDLRNHDITTAIVGAVNMGKDPVHREALEEVFPELVPQKNDVAVVLILEKLSDAKRLNRTIYATINDTSSSDDVLFNEKK